jgi:hypothetical protein
MQHTNALPNTWNKNQKNRIALIVMTSEKVSMKIEKKGNMYRWNNNK